MDLVAVKNVASPKRLLDDFRVCEISRGIGESLVVWSNGPATVAKELKSTNCSFAFSNNRQVS